MNPYFLNVVLPGVIILALLLFWGLCVMWMTRPVCPHCYQGKIQVYSGEYVICPYCKGRGR